MIADQSSAPSQAASQEASDTAASVEEIASAKKAAATALDIVQDTLRDTAFVGPRVPGSAPRSGPHWGMYDLLENLNRAARTVSDDDGKNPASMKEKEAAFSNALRRAIRNADAIASRANEREEVKEKSRALATRLRSIAYSNVTQGAAQTTSVAPASENVAWGEPVEGIQLGLVYSKNASALLPVYLPHLEMQIRNMGTHTVNYSCYLGETAQIEIDGVWYEQGGVFVTAICPRPSPLAPGTRTGKIPLSLRFYVSRKIIPFDKLNLTPGKHSIRVRTSVGDFPVITLVSNSVTVEVPTQTAPDPGAVGDAVDGIQLHWP